tara:strand:+ start:165 stop:476 length:312 start_codon:yes stop_codon:yes gene_type:complete
MPSDLENLEAKRDWMELTVRNVQEKTNHIKYNDVPSDICLEVQRLAEDTGIDQKELEYKIDEVRNCVNSLESAIYELVEPFEDRKRVLDNKIDELEEELEADA